MVLPTLLDPGVAKWIVCRLESHTLNLQVYLNGAAVHTKGTELQSIASLHSGNVPEVPSHQAIFSGFGWEPATSASPCARFHEPGGCAVKILTGEVDQIALRRAAGFKAYTWRSTSTPQ